MDGGEHFRRAGTGIESCFVVGWPMCIVELGSGKW